MPNLLVVVQRFSYDPRFSNKPLGSDEFLIKDIEKNPVSEAKLKELKKRVVRENKITDYAVIVSTTILPR